MRLKKTNINLILLLIIFVIGSRCYFRNGQVRINADIPSDKITAKGLVEIAKPYVDRYWGKRNYYVGEIKMELNSSSEGKVEIWYKDERKNKAGIPNIITVEFDTKARKILRIVSQERNSKIVPGIVNIEKWSIDSCDAIEVAKNLVKEQNDFDYKFAYVSASEIFHDSKEKWSITLFSEESKEVYYLEIDAYTGYIYKSKEK